ncbi:MAG TPA: DVU3141 family protein [Magnetospirillum sp.]|nr:DVU3141 family protein [Magnetospirillum sp.]
MNFVTSNAVGAEAPLDDPYFGGEVIVRVDQEYVSAAGRQCRRFHARSVRQGDAGQPFHACVVDNAWVLVGVY